MEAPSGSACSYCGSAPWHAVEACGAVSCQSVWTEFGTRSSGSPLRSDGCSSLLPSAYWDSLEPEPFQKTDYRISVTCVRACSWTYTTGLQFDLGLFAGLFTPDLYHRADETPRPLRTRNLTAALLSAACTCDSDAAEWMRLLRERLETTVYGLDELDYLKLVGPAL